MIEMKGWYAELARLKNRVNNLGITSAPKYRTLVKTTLRMLAEESPQWSGYFASNWRITYSGGRSISNEDEFAQEILLEARREQFDFGLPTVKQRGDPEAVEACLEANEGAIAKIPSAFTRVTFYNPTDYAQIIAKNADPENPKWQLRPVNVTSPKPIPIGAVRARLPEVAASIPDQPTVSRRRR